MGTWLEVRVEADQRETALLASEAALRAIQGVEARLSTWTGESELARLNGHPVGERFALSPELAADLALARELALETSGAFDPALGPLVHVWGLRSGGRAPSADELATARAASGMSAFLLEDDVAVRLHPGASFEEGGFGKGIGLDAALQAARTAGARSAVVDLGGQLAVLGTVETTVGLAHPQRRDELVAELELVCGSVATSGNSERGIVVAGERRSHLLDPRTGRPAEDFGSITVRAADATRADALATGLYVLGPQRALEFAARTADVEVVVVQVVQGALQIHASAGWRGRLRSLDPGTAVRFHGETRSVSHEE